MIQANVKKQPTSQKRFVPPMGIHITTKFIKLIFRRLCGTPHVQFRLFAKRWFEDQNCSRAKLEWERLLLYALMLGKLRSLNLHETARLWATQESTNTKKEQYRNNTRYNPKWNRSSCRDAIGKTNRLPKNNWFNFFLKKSSLEIVEWDQPKKNQ